VDLNPSVGHEPAKARPAIVNTDWTFNSRSPLVGVVPVRSTDSGHPLHVPVSDPTKSPMHTHGLD